MAALWLLLAGVPRPTPTLGVSAPSVAPMLAPKAPASRPGLIGDAHPQFERLAREYQRHRGPVQYGGQIWLADDDGRVLTGFVAVAPAPAPPVPTEQQIRQQWDRFYQDERWGDWGQSWLATAWLGELAEPLSHNLVCRERRCLVGHDFAEEAGWLQQVARLRQQLPRHVELAEWHTPSQSLLVFTRY
ncbi:hypothetical protein [Ferrimonas balearica]|uniref:hypothetical protein n=1 Tax=Ferrimonas balearica TaxID=44012 RepID=UPI001C993098|nr:hypothetical protein [Ferrimonas balearica]MBY5992979.1 hypothetical protein [Ferrimonas balearica]